jgi:hypothetical protein
MPPEGASPMVWRSALFLVATTVRLGFFVWRELKADAELRVYNYYKPQSPLFVRASPMGSHPEFEPGRQRDENGDCVFGSANRAAPIQF